jgi:hypothetical protein
VQEEEAKRELEKMELLTQARTNAAVTAEKARHLEDTKELQIQVLAFIDYYHRPRQLFHMFGHSERFDS